MGGHHVGLPDVSRLPQRELGEMIEMRIQKQVGMTAGADARAEAAERKFQGWPYVVQWWETEDWVMVITLGKPEDGHWYIAGEDVEELNQKWVHEK